MCKTHQYPCLLYQELRWEWSVLGMKQRWEWSVLGMKQRWEWSVLIEAARMFGVCVCTVLLKNLTDLDKQYQLANIC